MHLSLPHPTPIRPTTLILADLDNKVSVNKTYSCIRPVPVDLIRSQDLVQEIWCRQAVVTDTGIAPKPTFVLTPSHIYCVGRRYTSTNTSKGKQHYLKFSIHNTMKYFRKVNYRIQTVVKGSMVKWIVKLCSGQRLVAILILFNLFYDQLYLLIFIAFCTVVSIIFKILYSS